MLGKGRIVLSNIWRAATKGRAQRFSGAAHFLLALSTALSFSLLPVFAPTLFAEKSKTPTTKTSSPTTSDKYTSSTTDTKSGSTSTNTSSTSDTKSGSTSTNTSSTSDTKSGSTSTNTS